MKKIRNKILFSINGCVLIMSIVVGVLILAKVNIDTSKQAKETMKAAAIVNGKDLNKTFISAQTIVGDLNCTIKGIIDEKKLQTDPEECERLVVPIVKNLNALNSDFVGIYVAFNPELTRGVNEIFFEDVKGNGVHQRTDNDDIVDFKGNNPAMKWYYDAIKQKKGVWSNPYVDELSENTAMEMISYSEPIYKNDILLGVVRIDINYKKYVETINNIVIKPKGYAFLLNDKYDYIVHSQQTSKDDFQNTEDGRYREITEIMNKIPSGSLECDYNGEKRILGYTHLINNWIIVTSAPSKAFYDDMQNAIIYALIALIIGVIVSSRVAIRISKKISEPVVQATNFAEELAKGNLEEKLFISSGDETEILGNSLNKAAENICSLFEELKATEEELIYQVEELKKSEETVSELAYKNSVTGVLNKHYFSRYIPKALGRLDYKNKQGAIICLDIDNFKMINDTLGHSVGDEFLRKVSELLKEIIDNEEHLFHFGGDEFTVFIPNLYGIEDVKNYAERILSVFRQTIIADGHEIFYSTVSIGIAMYPENGKDLETLYKNADAALHSAKNNGKNTYNIFDEVMNREMAEKLKMENYLTKAVDNNEFHVYYQPKVDTHTGKVVSMEALVRWISPELGFVPPVRFIPLAEETGLILSIGEIVLRESCRQNKVWHDKGYNSLKVAVNLSAKQLQQKNIVSLISNVLKETGLEPQWLELEITESILMHNFEYTIKILEELRTLGINIYLDDFGTGYSSLNYLRQLPINSIKIDKSFIDGLTIDKKDSFIASSLIDLAHGINLSVVAEGVESIEQLELLKEYGCDEIQGYYFSKPLNSSDFERFLKRNNLDKEE